MLWNNFFNYPGASSMIGGTQFAPFVATGPPYQLPWLPNVRLVSVLSTARFPSGVNLQAPVCWNSPTWQGHEECIQSIQSEEWIKDGVKRMEECCFWEPLLRVIPLSGVIQYFLFPNVVQPFLSCFKVLFRSSFWQIDFVCGSSFTNHTWSIC